MLTKLFLQVPVPVVIVVAVVVVHFSSIFSVWNKDEAGCIISIRAHHAVSKNLPLFVWFACGTEYVTSGTPTFHPSLCEFEHPSLCVFEFARAETMTTWKCRTYWLLVKPTQPEH
jgi:hypothetical protein